ncbi:hypothetical protein EB796_012817 [Bugula neritina]|uniref:Major facilitator superfamily (MFS) profile domain-containing protein n=1 Tax=Bugula neritina TaxID=10212 RepID=A0A7J7JSG2_BUGNE|nr:hypothetical protein EB796_012817 [Bugula neritina]
MDDLEDTETLKERSKIKQILSLIVLCAVQFFAISSESAMYSCFPPAAFLKDMNNVQIGLVFSSYELARLLASPVAGLLVARITPKKIGLCGLLITGAMCIAFSLAYYASNSYYFLLCMVTRFLAGIGAAFTTVSVMTLAMKSVTFLRTTSIMGIVEAAVGAGHTGGPAIGGGLYELSGLVAAFSTIGAALIVLAVFLVILVPNVEAKKSTAEKSSFELLKIPGVALLLITVIVCNLVISWRTVFYSGFLYQTFGLGPGSVALIFVAVSSFYVMLCPLTSYVLGKGYIFSMMLALFTLNVVLLLFIGPSPLLDFIFHHKNYLPLTLTCHFMTMISQQGANIPPFKAMLDLAVVNGYKEDSLELYGMTSGLVNCGLGVGWILGPGIGGKVVEEVGYGSSLTYLAFLQFTLISIIIIYLLAMKFFNKPLRQTADNLCQDYDSLLDNDSLHKTTASDSSRNSGSNSGSRQVSNIANQLIRRLHTLFDNSVTETSVVTCNLQPKS